MYACILKLLITIHFYITQVPLSTEDTVSISNIEQCHDSILTMSLGLFLLVVLCVCVRACVYMYMT